MWDEAGPHVCDWPWLNLNSVMLLRYKCHDDSLRNHILIYLIGSIFELVN
jgi:hypothetical protein